MVIIVRRWHKFLILLTVGFGFAQDLQTVLERLARGIADDEAITTLQTVVQHDPKAPAWWAWLGFAHALRNDWDSSAKAYEQARVCGAQPSFPWFPQRLPVDWMPTHGNMQVIKVGDETLWQSPSVFIEPRPLRDHWYGERFHRISFVYGCDKGQGDKETGRQGDTKTQGQGDKERQRHKDTGTRRHGDMETRRHGEDRDMETRRQGDKGTQTHYQSSVANRQSLSVNWVQWLSQTNETPVHLRDVPVVFALALRWFSQRLETPVSLPIRLWLFSQGRGEAFTVVGNTLFYGTTPNDRWRWWLKAAHEAGHHTIPAFGEFLGMHESYAGGFLGERLFMLWLWDTGQGEDREKEKRRKGDIETQRLATWDAEIEQGLATYLRKTVVPEIVLAQQWLLAGVPDDEPPMHVFLGLCAYLERLGGIDLLREAMAKASGEDWKAFQSGVAKAISDRLGSDGLTLSFAVPDANTNPATFDLALLSISSSLVPRPLSLQLALWLPKGELEGELVAQGKGRLQMLWETEQVGGWQIASEEPTKLGLRLTVRQTGWRRLRFWWSDGKGKLLKITLRKSPKS